MELLGLFPEEIKEWLQSHGIPAFRGDQIFSWLHKHAVERFEQMTNVPGDVILRLQEAFGTPWPLELAARRRSLDGTEKYLFALKDQTTIETVYLPEEERQTVCLSTQVGCAMNCSFCATGQSGYVRNLSAAEIVTQVLWLEHQLRAFGKSITNVVYMGMGEPLANYGAVLRSAHLLNHPQGRNLGARRLTISTCGLVPQIRALANEELQVNLAVSLHAVTDADRSRIMPVNRRFPLQELLQACDYYTQQTNRRISYEYALIGGVNDSLAAAHRLRQLLQGLLCHVNLIPINPVGTERRPSMAKVAQFAKVLEEGRVPVSIRKERGTDIEAACGQLRQTQLQE